MALSDPRYLFGIHSICPYNRTTKIPYGAEMRVLGGSNFAITGEQISLQGGSSRFDYATEDGALTAEISLTSREYPDWAFELFLGKSLTENGAEASGNVSALTNASGTSVSDASTGIASIAAETVADLKFGKYVVKAASATTVDVYSYTDLDFARGTNGSLQDDDMSITASPLTVTDAGGTTAIANFGVTITGGSGTVDMTIGDTATFEVRPVATNSYTATIGGSADVYPDFGLYCTAQQHGTGRMFAIDIYKCKAIGMPLGFSEREFSEWELTMKASYDSTRSGVFDLTEIVI